LPTARYPLSLHDALPIFPPPSLRQAIGSFVLACAARVCRGHVNEHSSMLVHVTRFTAVQDAVMFQVREEVASMRRRLTRKVDHEDRKSTRLNSSHVAISY